MRQPPRIIPDFDLCVADSTCRKRVTVCELYSEDRKLLARESNRCFPVGGVCSRLEHTDTQKDYPAESECNWSHAEVRAIRSLRLDDKPHFALLYGHNFICPSCAEALEAVGVVITACIPAVWGAGPREIK